MKDTRDMLVTVCVRRLALAVAAAVLLLVLCAPLAAAARADLPVTWAIQQAELTGRGSARNDLFGIAVAVDGDTALVGSSGWSLSASRGAAYFFTRTGGVWSEQAMVVDPADTRYDYFGQSVALDGDTALIGAFGDNGWQGAAYVFTRSGATWRLQARLTASDGSRADDFGVALALHRGTALIGAGGKGDGRGAAYVFTGGGAGWTQQTELAASDGARGDGFGNAVALEDGAALIGAARKGGAQGAAYVFTGGGASWTQRAELAASDGARGDNFGSAVALDGATALIGAPGARSRQGAAYIFTRCGGSWTQRVTLAADEYVRDVSDFGVSVALSDGTALVGAYDADTLDQYGAAYVFLGGDTSWRKQAKLTPEVPDEGDSFGYSVALSGGTAVAGADGRDMSRGAAFVFALGPSHVIDVTAGPNGTVEPACRVRVPDGGDQAFTFLPDPYCHVSEVSVGGVPVVPTPEDSWTVRNVTRDTTLSVAFAPDTYTVTPSVAGGLSGHGSISPATPQTLPCLSRPTFTFRPDVGYAIRAVLVDGVRVGLTTPNAYAFPPLLADHTISVEFAAQRFTITSSAGPHGTISPAGAVRLPWGGAQSYAIGAAPGYHVAEVRVDGRSVGAVTSYLFASVAADHTICASFAADLFAVSALVGTGGHGTVTPAGTSFCPFGATPSYVFTPQRGYYAGRLTLDGLPIAFTAPNRYTFAPLSAGHTLQVFFMPAPR